MTVCFTGVNVGPCNRYPYEDDTCGELFWTGGQRVDLSYGSPFVWTQPPGCSDGACVSAMTYINWRGDEPNNSGDWINSGGNFRRKASSSSPIPEHCLQLCRTTGCDWNDGACQLPTCSVCEIDL